jgi:hypothetical protein
VAQLTAKTKEKVNLLKTIVFRHRTGYRDDDCFEEEFEFDDNATEEEITEAYKDWVWNEIGDEFTWYKKEN